LGRENKHISVLTQSTQIRQHIIQHYYT
jgi:hypothetical protein